jgi:hypothetical protein
MKAGLCGRMNPLTVKDGGTTRMKIEIKSRLSGSVLFSIETENLRLAVEAAVKSGANLSGADLSGANLSGADLSGANLSRADLYGADLSGAKNAALAIAQTRILPEGSIVGWKALRGGVIAQLHIPASAKRSHAFGRKCRAECAEVLALLKGEEAVTVGYSQHDSDFEYRVGAIVVPAQAFDTNWQEECASGIHFFITREEAEAYT